MTIAPTAKLLVATFTNTSMDMLCDLYHYPKSYVVDTHRMTSISGFCLESMELKPTDWDDHTVVFFLDG